jgi:hypothetical protein
MNQNLKRSRLSSDLEFVKAHGVEIDQLQLLDHQGRLELAPNRKRRNRLENRKRRASFTRWRHVVDANLVVWELEILVRDRDSIQLSQTQVPVIDHGFKP